MTGSQAAYSLVPVVKEPRINPGGDIEIDIYISGGGEVEAAQLFILHSRPTQDFDSLAEVKSNLAPLDEQEFNRGQQVLTGTDADDSDYILERKGLRNGTHVPIPPQLFEPSGFMAGNGPNFPFGIRYTERPYEDENDEMKLPPFEYTLPTTKHTDPGDYAIHTILTYETPNGDIYQDKNQSTVTVKNSLQKHNKGLTYARYSIAVLALLSLFVTAFSAALTAGII